MAEPSDHSLAAQIAEHTGRLLVELLERPVSDRRWPGLGDEGDRAAHYFIIEALRSARPHDPVLSEESPDDSPRLLSERVWIVDPLDGSSDFGYSPRWSVHVALVEAGEPTAGAVAVPGWAMTWCTDPVPEPPMGTAGPRPRIVVPRARGRVDGPRLQAELDAEVYALGSAGVKAMAVVRGEVDAYVHGGALLEWDTCAPVAVARAAGLVCCRLDGSPLEFNKPDPWTPGLIISQPDLVDDLVSVMGDRQG